MECINETVAHANHFLMGNLRAFDARGSDNVTILVPHSFDMQKRQICSHGFIEIVDSPLVANVQYRKS